MLHLAGGLSDRDSIELDMTGVQKFDRRVDEIARAIRRGRSRSYGEIAAKLGDPGSATRGQYFNAR